MKRKQFMKNVNSNCHNLNDSVHSEEDHLQVSKEEVPGGSEAGDADGGGPTRPRIE